MLEVASTAAVDEIKRAFRREIAKYHPDKVQHLGKEFQDIAAVKAAELTQAYKTLTDDALRAEYDAQIAEGVTPGASPPPPSPSHAPPKPDAPPARPSEAAARPAAERVPEPEPQGRGSYFSQERAGASDLVRRATVMRFKQSLEGEFGRYEESPLPGFDVFTRQKIPAP